MENTFCPYILPRPTWHKISWFRKIFYHPLTAGYDGLCQSHASRRGRSWLLQLSRLVARATVSWTEICIVRFHMVNVSEAVPVMTHSVITTA